MLKTQQEVGVIEEFAVQDLERNWAITHPNLLSQEDCTHATLAQAADNVKAAGQPGCKLRFGLSGLGG